MEPGRNYEENQKGKIKKSCLEVLFCGKSLLFKKKIEDLKIFIKVDMLEKKFPLHFAFFGGGEGNTNMMHCA